MELTATALRYTYPKTGFSLMVDSFTMGEGRCVALCGRNGSGKTTLGKLLCGILRPDGGQVLLGGEDTAAWPLGRIGGQVGYLFQEPSRQLFAPQVGEELTFPLVLKGLPQQEADSRADILLQRFELSHLRHRSTYMLSRGEQQRLAVCAMLMNKDLRFIILDEPTTGLDTRRRTILGAMMRELLRDGLGILLISHDLPFVQAHASHVVTMEGGRLTDG